MKVLLLWLFTARHDPTESWRGMLDAYRTALTREHRRDPERRTGLEPHE